MRAHVANEAAIEPLAAPIGEIDRAILDLRRSYEFRDQEDVEDFLRRYPDVVPLLEEARERFAVLEPAGPATLEVLWDPEDSGAQPELWVIVPTAEEPKQARPRLDRFRRDWLIDAFRETEAIFGVTLRYV